MTRLGWNFRILRKQIRSPRAHTVPLYVLIKDNPCAVIPNVCATALELAKHNITVNCYAPGIVVTQMGELHLHATADPSDLVRQTQRRIWAPVSLYVHLPGEGCFIADSGL